jgi:predicted nucleic acid-binding protein
LIVLDASVVVEWLAGGARLERVLPWLEAHEVELHAPDLVDVEVAHVLRRLTLTGAIDPARGEASVEILAALPVERHAVRPLLPRIWSLRNHLTAYDAAYVALAEALSAPLLTDDVRIARAPGLAVPVRSPDEAPGG